MTSIGQYVIDNPDGFLVIYASAFADVMERERAGVAGKLSEADVRAIRLSRDAATDLARRHGVSREAIDNVRRGSTYRWVS